MEFREFVNEIKCEVACKLGKEYEVSVSNVIKNNGVELVGLIIHKEGEGVAPNIYLNEFFNMEYSLDNLEIVVEKILETYNDAMNTELANQFKVNFEFDTIKDNIYYRVVNYGKNKKLLETVPHKKFLDLAIIYYCLVNNDEDNIASIRITNKHMEKWGINKNDLLEIASENTPKLFPGVIRNMKDVLKDLLVRSSFASVFGEDDRLEEDSNVYYYKGKKLEDDVIEMMISAMTRDKDFDMYVLTNVNGINGASTILYNGLIESFANKVKANVIILPCSIHEVIMIPYSTAFTIEELKEMVKEINGTKVPEGEILSDSVYVYQRKECALIM